MCSLEKNVSNCISIIFLLLVNGSYLKNLMKNHKMSLKLCTIFLVLMYPRTSLCIIYVLYYVLYVLLIVSLCSIRSKFNSKFMKLFIRYLDV